MSVLPLKRLCFCLRQPTLQFGNQEVFQAVMFEAGLSVSGNLGLGLVSPLLSYIVSIPHLL